MKITFSSKSLEQAPVPYVRVAFTKDDKGVKRLVREGKTDTIEIGMGTSGINRRQFVTLCRSVIQTAKQHRAKRIAIQFDRTPELFKGLDLAAEEASQIAAENFEMANFEFTAFKTTPKNGWNTVEEVLVCGKSSKSIEAAAKRGQLIGQEINACRALANTPGGSLTPKLLARAAKDAVRGLEKVTVTTLTRAQMEKLGMGALLGVAAGSPEEPTFTIMEYKGAAGKPVVLAGKGITFDTGGYNLKPSEHMYEMHMDMSGAASVIHAVAAVAKLGIKKHVIGLLPAAENMVSGNATRPGDILKSMSGKTIEVTNTDAEGRLVLADALTYAKRYDPSVVLDVATLTGAAHVALGHYASALMTRDDALADTLLILGEESGDYLWRLPLWDEYESALKSSFADLVNSPLAGARYGGATNGGMFLWQFAKELKCPWAHIDTAPKTSAAPGEELAKGAAGTPVRLLIRFIESWKA
jgi:leucyl aminopeptidase